MKIKKVFACQSCGFQSPKWLGKCPDCSQWNSFAEETYTEQPAHQEAAKGAVAVKQALAKSGGDAGAQSAPKKIEDIDSDESLRVPTRFKELDRVLGGGIVPGSLVLIGGDPGIGKSTILMQALPADSQTILYVSGEESDRQIKLRALRLGIESQNLFIYAENCFESILDQIQKIKPQILIIDSIQTIYTSASTSAPGSVSQIRECTAKLMVTAKTLGVATFIVGHITKEGSIAGPKILEHMVDTVLYFENSSSHTYRLLRAVKNRFGSTNEIGVFEMVESGLREVANPSELFLQERPQNAAGTVVISAIEGSRPILVEVQALVSSTNLGMPRRTTLGVDHNKVSLLVAIIEKKLDLPLYGHDIFVNVAGGIDLDEPAVDLGIALSLISSFRNHPLDSKLLVCGEVGLAGEVRHISQLEMRVTEAKKLGFQSAIVPRSSLEKLPKAFKNEHSEKNSFRIIGVTSLSEAMNVAFEL